MTVGPCHWSMDTLRHIRGSQLYSTTLFYLISFPSKKFSSEELTSRLGLRAKRRARAWPWGWFPMAINREI